MIMRYIIYCFFLFNFIGCNGISEKNNTSNKPGKDEMADLNEYLVQKDRERIESYIERKDLKMKQTHSGLWYTILNTGTGDYFKDGSTFSIEYDCSLLDGTLCYSSSIRSPKKITVGNGEIESGLNEGLKLLKPGAEAIFILPPYLAFGLVGDGNMIPARSVIVYKVRVISNN
jgi:FKBP-type peptidyl-prolyl cis-trans isomerase FkpA